jgi:predicted ABC-class ATPase
MGAGWYELEHQEYGIPFPRIGVRMDMLDEACRILRSLWTQETTTYEGRHYQLKDARMEPKPVQEHLPLVIGGSGDYLDVADTVVAMTGYVPSDLTDRAREVAAAHPTGRIPEASGAISEPPPRIPLPASVDPSRGRRKVSIRVRDTGRVQFGRGEIDLSGVDQLVSPAQTRAMSEALLLARERFMDGKRSVPRILDLVMETLERDGLDALGYGDSGNLALFRRYELAAALNRLRGLRVAGPGEPSPNQETGP